MKRVLIPYYVSRAVLSALLGVVVAYPDRPWWTGLGVGALVFAVFLWYAHSGHYQIDPTTPLTPLRRDERGGAIRDRAVVWAVAAGGILFALLSLAGAVFQTTIAAGSLALLSSVVIYFAVSNWLHIRDA
jgi:hypothetical protein